MKPSFSRILYPFSLCLALLAGSQSFADVVVLTDGQVISGEVLQQDEKGVLIKMDYGTFTFPNSRVKDVKKEVPSARLNENTVTNRIPDWGRILTTLKACEWGNGLKQIPATVIETGSLKNVPYVSFRCAGGCYELNIYGDLDRPAGFEIGVQKPLLQSDAARSNCVEFVCSTLRSEDDRKVVREIKWTKDVVKRDGLTFETTLPTEEDSYGAWWISIYDETEIVAARASGKEILAISEPVFAQKKPQAITAQPTRQDPIQPLATWTTEDWSYARQPRVSTGGAPNASGGRVYVSGYTRKDGTYVSGHYRSSPRSR
jgi:hypothetical protein